MNTGYDDIDELKASQSLGGESFADPDLELAIAAASRAIDEMTRRRFYKDDNANQIRYYTPPATPTGDRRVLIIDDLAELTALAIDPAGLAAYDQPWTLNLHFVLEPLNAQADGRPWTALRIPRNGAYSFPVDYERSVRVTGRFGWPAVPQPIKQATRILAVRLMKRSREAPFGIASLGMEGVAARIAREDPELCTLVKPFARGTGIAGLA